MTFSTSYRRESGFSQSTAHHLDRGLNHLFSHKRVPVPARSGHEPSVHAIQGRGAVTRSSTNVAVRPQYGWLTPAPIVHPSSQLGADDFAVALWLHGDDGEPAVHDSLARQPDHEDPGPAGAAGGGG